eukprot:11037916-Ditylum_brightwellii.AAC.1
MTMNNNNNDNIYDEDTAVLDTPSVSDNKNNNDSSVWSLDTASKDDDIHKIKLENLLVISLAKGVDWFGD